MTELSNGSSGGTKRRIKRAIRLRPYRGSPEDRMDRTEEGINYFMDNFTFFDLNAFTQGQVIIVLSWAVSHICGLKRESVSLYYKDLLTAIQTIRHITVSP